MGTTINRPRRNPKTSDKIPLSRRKQQFHDNNKMNKKKINNGQDETMLARLRAKSLVMGQVKILKRGEDLKNDKKDENDEELYQSSTDRLGPEPEILLQQIQQIQQIRVCDSDVAVEKVEKMMYAGISAFQSPPPSSLPCPGFAGERVKIRFGLRLLLGLGNSVL